MTEAAQSAAAPAAPNTLTITQAAQALAEKRAAPQTNEITAHASAMGKRSAEARKERTTEATQPHEADEAGDQEQDDETQGTPEGETLTDDTDGNEPSNEANAEADGEPDANQTIDLGEGLTATLDEVRDNFMFKADHTRKTQALAEERKEFEAVRQQKLAHFDQLIVAAQATLGQPKSLKQWLAEDPVDGMMRFAEQQERFEQFGGLIQARQQEQAHYVGNLKQSTIKALGEKHGDKAEDVFSKAVQYVASKTGTDKSALEGMLSHPEAIAIVHDAIAYRELKSKEPSVRRTVAEKPKVVKPGGRVTSQGAAQSALKVAQEKARKSGSVADALAYLRAKRTAGGQG